MMALMGTAWVALFAFCATINAGGAIGDLWIAKIVLRYPASAYIMDERDGVRVFLPGETSLKVEWRRPMPDFPAHARPDN